MTKARHTTTPSKFNKSKIMKRAWEIFRSTYSYPEIPFKSIGWLCFASCLKMAWAEFKRPVAVDTRPLPEQLASLQYAHKLNQMSDNFYTTPMVAIPPPCARLRRWRARSRQKGG